MAEKPMSNQLREQIKIYIKNGIDIAQLIDGVCIKDENLSGATIGYLNKINFDISNCNFSNCILGGKDNAINIIKCKMNNCDFNGAIFRGLAFIRHCEAKGCNFKNSDVADVDYQYTDFSNSTFCEAKIRISSKSGMGCIFPKEMWYNLTQNWVTKIKVDE